MPRIPARTKTARLPGRGLIREAPVLKNITDYLSWEGFWYMRTVPGAARVGGRPVALHPSHMAILKNAHRELKSWDGTVRVGEYWIQGPKEGTPDIVLMVPAGRRIVNPWTREPETAEAARVGFIEAKRPGESLRPDQRDFSRSVEKQGGLMWVIDSPEELRRMIPPKNELRFY